MNSIALHKRTYSLPDKTLARFEAVVPNGERSRAIARLVEDWLERERLLKLRQEIIAGCEDMADEYLSLSEAYYPLEEEVTADAAR